MNCNYPNTKLNNIYDCLYEIDNDLQINGDLTVSGSITCDMSLTALNLSSQTILANYIQATSLSSILINTKN